MSSRVSVTADVTSGFGYLSYLSDEAYASLGAMDGIFEPSAPPVTAKAEARKASELLPGYALAGVVAAAAYGVHYLPFAPFQVVQGAAVRRPISSAIIAILLGLLIRNAGRVPATIGPGCKRVVRRAIPIAIILAAADLNLVALAKHGWSVLLITILCLSFGVLAGYGSARLLGLRPKLGLLLGVGTGVCGNSAIVAIAPLIEAEDEDLLLSIGTVNLMGLLVMLVCPLAGELLGLSQHAFGIWAGTTVHAVPQAVAAGFTYGPQAGSLATAVKLIRVALLAPLVLIVAYAAARRRADGAADRPHPIVHFARLVPWFVWGFAILAGLCTLGMVPSLTFPAGPLVDGGSVSLTMVLKETGNILLTLAMAAIGLEVDLRMMIGVSVKALLAGALSSAALLAASLAMVMLMGG